MLPMCCMLRTHASYVLYASYVMYDSYVLYAE